MAATCDSTELANSTIERMTVPALVEDSSKLVISPLNQLVTIWLEENNFLLWRTQVENTIKGYGHEGFIYGTNQVPSKFLTGPNNETVPIQHILPINAKIIFLFLGFLP